MTRIARSISWRYALGELLIVVVGILLAVQIDRWNAGRERADVAQSYLDRLARDLEADVEVLTGNAAQMLRRSESADRILSWMEDASSAPQDADLRTAINRARGGTLTPLRGATYQDLVSGGNLALFRDVGLRDAIISYYESVPATVTTIIADMDELGWAMVPSMGRHIDDRVLYGRADRRDELQLFVTNWRAFASDPVVSQQLRVWAPASYDTSRYLTEQAAKAQELLDQVIEAGGDPKTDR